MARVSINIDRLLLIAISIAFWLMVGHWAFAADSASCSIYAREKIAVERTLHPEITADQIPMLELRFWAICLNSDRPPNAKRCEKEYKSYDANDGTVLRRGKTEREPCPL